MVVDSLGSLFSSIVGGQGSQGHALLVCMLACPFYCPPLASERVVEGGVEPVYGGEEETPTG